MGSEFRAADYQHSVRSREIVIDGSWTKFFIELKKNTKSAAASAGGFSAHCMLVRVIRITTRFQKVNHYMATIVREFLLAA